MTDVLSKLLGDITGPDLQEVLEGGQGHVEAEGESVAEKEDEELIVLKSDAVVHLKDITRSRCNLGRRNALLETRFSNPAV